MNNVSVVSNCFYFLRQTHQHRHNAQYTQHIMGLSNRIEWQHWTLASRRRERNRAATHSAAASSGSFVGATCYLDVARIRSACNNKHRFWCLCCVRLIVSYVELFCVCLFRLQCGYGRKKVHDFRCFVSSLV